MQILRQFPVWDYADQHVTWMRETWGIDAQWLPLGYVPPWTRIPRHGLDPDIDVLFYARRQALLSELEQVGLTVAVVQSTYGVALDAWIARARVVVNIHRQWRDN